MAKRKRRQRVTRQELEDLGVDPLDTKTRNGKSPAFRRNRRKRELLNVLRNTLGNVTASCQKVGVSRATFYLWRQEDPEFDEEVNEINETTLDFVENQLMKGIKEGNTRLIMFYLTAKGRSRGYGQTPVDAAERRQLKVVITQDEAEF